MNMQAIMVDGMETSPLLAATWVAALLGALVLNRFTRISGVIGFVLNAIVLFAGAEAAKLLMANLSLPFDYLIDRTLFISFSGMLVASFGMLVLFSRPWQG